VKGDVHDIGKNLVDIILSNNGFEVRNLGIKQPIEKILEAHHAWKADAIGLSGLLVKSTVIMKENLQYLKDQGLEVPVILGGAALTRAYVEQECRQVYGGPVLYAEDAFEGLRHMQALVNGSLSAEATAPKAPSIRVLRRGEGAMPLTAHGQSSFIRHGHAVPTPPFWGVKEVAHPVEDLFAFLDEFVVLRNRWSFTQGALSDEAFAEVLRTKAEPELARWKKLVASEGLLKPRARYGYFPVAAAGDDLKVFDPADSTKEIGRFRFPRQQGGRRLCIADHFLPEVDAEPGGRDVLALQVVSLGDEAAAHAKSLYEAEHFGDYFYFHGLATELTEAYAELLHAQVRRELGIHAKDAPQLRQLFSQGYQGSRYSFGYPACPDLEGNAPILQLLDGEQIGVRLTETFQMDPEYATSAVIAWHPQARYFAV
jgi:5-methyltetrahydrofolate--homocysteine methyltransferase